MKNLSKEFVLENIQSSLDHLIAENKRESERLAKIEQRYKEGSVSLNSLINARNEISKENEKRNAAMFELDILIKFFKKA